MPLKKKSAAELLAESKPLWICPITKVQIDAEDTDKIQAHKKKVLADLEAKARKQEIAKRVKAVHKVLDNELKVCGSLVQVTQAYNQFVQKLFPGTVALELDIERIEVPSYPSKVAFSVLNARKLSEDVLSAIGAVAAPRESVQKLKSRGITLPPGRKIIRVPVNAMAGSATWLRSIAAWQAGQARKTPKVTPEIHAELQCIPAYVAKTKELNAIAKKLHDMKAQYKALHDECEAIRAAHLSGTAEVCPFK